jgi:phosphoribosylamine--glycine ligase
MNTLPVLETPFLDVLVAAREGDSPPGLDFAERATVCKYVVPEGYPVDPKSGARIEVNEVNVGDALLFYASVDERDGELYTTTSRAFAVVGLGDDIAEAEAVAEEALSAGGEGLRVRHDIGTADLIRRRIEHVNHLRGR